MRRTMPSRVVLCLLAAFAASPASAQGNANATVCAADDDSAFSPEQRIAACSALINAARNAPKEVADALVNRGQAAWYADKMKQAFADLDRAIALDPNNARAFRERSNAYRSIGKLDRALGDASEAVRLIPGTPRPSTTAATCSSRRANTIARSKTTTKPCGLIRN